MYKKRKKEKKFHYFLFNFPVLKISVIIMDWEIKEKKKRLVVIFRVQSKLNQQNPCLYNVTQTT